MRWCEIVESASACSTSSSSIAVVSQPLDIIQKRTHFKKKNKYMNTAPKLIDYQYAKKQP